MSCRFDEERLYETRAGADERTRLGNHPHPPRRRCVGAVLDRGRIRERADFAAELAPALGSQPFGTHLYVCGPSGFMDDVTALAAELGWPPSRVHLERFGIDALEPGKPFVVRLAGSGEEFTVESGVSLLEALEARGHNIPNLCRQGVCGECRIPVSGGEILHRDLYLTEADREAGGSLMCCVSRAAGDRLELAL